MIIKKLELQGFKSFPERTKIIFHPGITTIIGPNGTGKSNIVDALLWVLGGKRLRSLGKEGSSTLIFNGNNKRAPLNMADVTLSLSDGDEGSKINHRFFRTGESEYRLNGKVVRLKDIHESLWEKSIGERDYFVIEQGSIGLFLGSKPLEKRALLEEAAGTAYYKDKKKQAQNKLDNSEQNLTRLEDIIAEVSRSKNSLKRQTHAAIRFRKLREEIRKLTSFHFRKKIEALEKKQESINLSFAEMTRQESRALDLLKTEEKNLATTRREAWELEKSIKEERGNLFSLKSQITQAVADKEKEAKKKEFNAQQKKKSLKRQKELEEESISLETELKRAEEVLKDHKEALKRETMNLENESRKSQSVEEGLAVKKQKIKDLRDEYFQLLSELTETRNSEVRLEKEIEITHRQKNKADCKLEQEQDRLVQRDKELHRITEEIAHKKTDLSEKKKELLETRSALTAAQSSLQDIRKEISELTEKRSRFVHQLQAIEKLEQTEREGTVAQDNLGTLGLLADLIETDDKHAPLVDVLWKEEAKAYVIHSHNLLSNLPHKKLKGPLLILHPQEKNPSLPKVYENPRVIGHLVSHVKPSKNIKSHLSRLKDAAIVKDLKTAVDLWIQEPSINYVTMEGEVLFSSGLLKSGQEKDGLLTLSREKKSLREKINRLDEKTLPLTHSMEEKQIQERRTEEKTQRDEALYRQIERKIEELTKEESFARAQREKLASDVAIVKKEVEVLVSDEKELARNMKSLASSREKLESKEAHLKQMIDTEEKDLSSQQESRELGRTKHFELKSNIEILLEKTQNTQIQIQLAAKRREVIKHNIISLIKELQLSEKEDKETQQTIRHLSEEITRLKNDVKQKESLLDRLEAILKEKSVECGDIEKKVEELEQNHETTKDERVKWEIKRAEVERDLVNLEESCWQELKKNLVEVKAEISPDIITENNIAESLDEAKELLQRIKDVNLMAEEEYQTHKERYDFLVKQKKDLVESILSTREAIVKIDKESKAQFSMAFHEVNKNFQEVFSLLFKGGHAEIRLSDPNHPLESGVEITAQPPGKRVQSLSLLSGGEKSLTSLAFFFALFRYKPTPFCILDEVDAALDEVNLARFLDLMKEIKKQTQFIIVTHNFKTMEVADYIYGTTMAEPNITNLYAVKMEARKGK